MKENIEHRKGNLYLKGHLGTPEVKLTGKIYDKEFYMERTKQTKGKFRPYSISEIFERLEFEVK